MKGKLYGVSVGPGDPTLLTVRSREILERAEVIAYPVRDPADEGTAVGIAAECVDVSGKEVVPLLFRMDPDDGVRERCRREAVERMCSMLDKGRDVAMVVLGDAAVYSTYMYLDREIRGRGYETEVVPGVPSFCHGAAKARIPLMIGEESLAVVSMAKHNLSGAERALDASDNVVLMKAFLAIPEIITMLEGRGIPLANATVMSNVGMEDEYIGPLDPDRKYGYFTTVLVKKGERYGGCSFHRCGPGRPRAHHDKR